MREDLIALCDRCFGDGIPYTQMMFRYLFAPENMLVYLSEGKPVAMMFFLPCQLQGEDKTIPCHYIYAACTDKEYRGRGLMSQMLEEVARLGAARGQAYSILVPAEESLFDYYGQRGYRTDFYRLHTGLTAGDVEAFHAQPAEIFPLSPDEITHIRANVWRDDPLTLIRDQNSIAFTMSDADWYGDRFLGLRMDGEKGYALCCPREDGVLIKELCCSPRMAQSALKAVNTLYHSDKYTVITPPFLTLGAGSEKKVPYGMARNLADLNTNLSMAEHTGLQNGVSPYINLMFD